MSLNGKQSHATVETLVEPTENPPRTTCFMVCNIFACGERVEHFIGSATPPSACYAHYFLHKLNRPICTFSKYWV